MRKYFLPIRVLAALVVLSIPVEAVADCLVTVEVYNRLRRGECPGGC